MIFWWSNFHMLIYNWMFCLWKNTLCIIVTSMKPNILSKSLRVCACLICVV